MGNTGLDLSVLVAAFATSEGYFVAGSIPQVCNNPTDLRFAKQNEAIPHGTGPNPFAQFSAPGIGICAAIRQMCAYIQQGYSLRKLVYVWAPPTDGNNSALYLSETIRRVQKACGIVLDPEKPLHEYLSIAIIP